MISVLLLGISAWVTMLPSRHSLCLKIVEGNQNQLIMLAAAEARRLSFFNILVKVNLLFKASLDFLLPNLKPDISE